MRKDVEKLAAVYAASLAAHGVTPKGLLWPNGTDLATRFEVLLGGINFQRYNPANRVRLLDLGCGPGFLLITSLRTSCSIASTTLASMCSNRPCWRHVL